jgi:hypothetical protein
MRPGAGRYAERTGEVGPARRRVERRLVGHGSDVAQHVGSAHRHPLGSYLPGGSAGEASHRIVASLASRAGAGRDRHEEHRRRPAGDRQDGAVGERCHDGLAERRPENPAEADDAALLVREDEPAHRLGIGDRGVDRRQPGRRWLGIAPARDPAEGAPATRAGRAPAVTAARALGRQHEVEQRPEDTAGRHSATIVIGQPWAAPRFDATTRRAAVDTREPCGPGPAQAKVSCPSHERHMTVGPTDLGYGYGDGEFGQTGRIVVKRITLLAPVLVAAVAWMPATASAHDITDRGRWASAAGALVRAPSGHLARTVPHVVGDRQQASGQQTPQVAPPPAGAATATATTTTTTGCPSVSGAYVCRAGTARSFAAGDEIDGAYMTTAVQSPRFDATDNHSLAELSVAHNPNPGSGTANDSIVEVGWRVAPRWYGDQTPRLFVYYWANGLPVDCYNGQCAAYHSYSTTTTPGMTLTPGTSVQFMIEHYQGNWWLGYNGSWFGYFPDSTWSNAYTKANVMYAFGEVSSPKSNPCSDMGNGNFGTSTAAASITNIGFYGGPSTLALSAFADYASYYNSQLTSSNSLRYGGPGAC